MPVGCIWVFVFRSAVFLWLQHTGLLCGSNEAMKACILPLIVQMMLAMLVQQQHTCLRCKYWVPCSWLTLLVCWLCSQLARLLVSSAMLSSVVLHCRFCGSWSTLPLMARTFAGAATSARQVTMATYSCGECVFGDSQTATRSTFEPSTFLSIATWIFDRSTFSTNGLFFFCTRLINSLVIQYFGPQPSSGIAINSYYWWWLRAEILDQ